MCAQIPSSALLWSSSQKIVAKSCSRPAQGLDPGLSSKNRCVSNDRSRHEDSNGPRIVKIGAILAIFEHFKVFV